MMKLIDNALRELGLQKLAHTPTLKLGKGNPLKLLGKRSRRRARRKGKR